jgi:hypothetical protein
MKTLQIAANQRNLHQASIAPKKTAATPSAAICAADQLGKANSIPTITAKRTIVNHAPGVRGLAVSTLPLLIALAYFAVSLI